MHSADIIADKIIFHTVCLEFYIFCHKVSVICIYGVGYHTARKIGDNGNPVRIIRIGNRFFTVFKEDPFCLKIIFKSFMIIQMILRQIGESGNVKSESVYSALRKRLGGYFHNAVFAALPHHQGKQFLQFMATDEAIELYVKASGGYRTMFEYDYNKPKLQEAMSSFMKSTNKLTENSQLFFMKHKDPIFSLTGYVFMRNGITGWPETYLSAVNPNDYLSASEIYQRNYITLKSQWDSYLATANIVR